MPMRVRAPHDPAKGGYPGFRPGTIVEDGMRIDRDVTVRMRDGSPIYVDLYRPEREVGDLATLTSWGPYGKHGGPGLELTHVPAAGIDPAWVSKHAGVESPDPAYWCRHGYAVVNPDPRGTWGSPGDFTMGTEQEAEDFHDLIEWAGAQSWSNGKVGTTGVSYLAIAQWRVAATRPSHLAAINPWEGLNDFYRELGHHGGIPERFMGFLTNTTMGFGTGRVEDLTRLFAEHPLVDEYWTRKDVDLSGVDVPAYVVAGWASQGLHLRGTLEAYKQLAGADKWLDIHGRRIWRHYYDPDSVERLRRFFDWALKGEDNGWPTRSRVVIEVRDRFDVGASRNEAEWPPARTELAPLHLNAASSGLTAAPAAEESHISYEATTEGDLGRAVFVHVFPRVTELTGHMKLRLWLQVDEATDADLFVAVHKLDADGDVVPFPAHGAAALGWLRASHRALDPARTTPAQPWHPHTVEEPLEPGVPVCVEIELWPSSTRFEAGDRLRLVVQGTDVYGPGPFAHGPLRNAGRHMIHTGGRYDSHLLVPVIPPTTTRA
jgi:predicted acyl esterase